MKKSRILSLILVAALLISVIMPMTASADPIQITEKFTTEAVDSNTFSEGGLSFNITGPYLDVDNYQEGAAWGFDDYLYVSNFNNEMPSATVAGSFVSTGSDFNVNSLYLITLNESKLIIKYNDILIHGKLDGTTVFTHTVPYNTINDSSYNNYYTFVDLSSYSSYVIDELEFEVDPFEAYFVSYLMIDDFKFTEVITNSTPTDIALSSTSIAENMASGTLVGTFVTTDADAGDTFTYSLVSGEGSTDYANFSIAGNTLKSAAVFDREAKSSYSIRVKTTDAAGASYEKAFTISVADIYEPPVLTTNSGLAMNEDAPAAAIGSGVLMTTVNSGRTATYTLTAAPSKGTLKNDGTALGTNDTFTQADINTSKLTYTPDTNANAADSFGFSVSDGTNSVADTFDVNITPVNDEPTLTATGANPTFAEGGSAASLYTAASASTVESGQSITTLTLTVTNVSDGGHEKLNIDGSLVGLTNGNSLTTAVNSLGCAVGVTGSTATVTITGTLSALQLKTLVEGIQYQNTSRTNGFGSGCYADIVER